jgi:hypothetical protein
MLREEPEKYWRSPELQQQHREPMPARAAEARGAPTSWGWERGGVGDRGRCSLGKSAIGLPQSAIDARESCAKDTRHINCSDLELIVDGLYSSIQDGTGRR